MHTALDHTENNRDVFSAVYYIQSGLHIEAVKKKRFNVAGTCTQHGITQKTINRFNHARHAHSIWSHGEQRQKGHWA